MCCESSKNITVTLNFLALFDLFLAYLYVELEREVLKVVVGPALEIPFPTFELLFVDGGGTASSDESRTR